MMPGKGRWLVVWKSRVHGSSKGGFLVGGVERDGDDRDSFSKREALELAESHMVLDPTVFCWAVERPDFARLPRVKPKETFLVKEAGYRVGNI
jgi:hypothetical protein